MTIPAVLVAVAVYLRASGLDYEITNSYFDAGAGVFPRRADGLLELIGHSLARDFATLVWFCLTGAAIASFGVDELRAYRSILWLTVGAMAAGPILVVVLKEFTSFPCPWSLSRYGGLAPEPVGWFVMPVNAGRCFPAGHSAGGFCFVAFYFAALAMRRDRLASVALVFTVIAGCAFSFVRVVQGAHFVSHALWSAAIDWLLAALIFAPALSGRWSMPVLGLRNARRDRKV